MKRMVLVSMFASLLTGGSGPAMADDLRGDLRVMRPNGTVRGTEIATTRLSSVVG
jgi:hypothetical protein